MNRTHPAYDPSMSDSLAEEIRAAREARKWDQTELARMVGVGQQTISRWERGRTAPTGTQLDRLRAVLGMDGAATPPRRPLLQELPFNRLDAYEFEAFCAALASGVFADAHEVTPYGVNGDTQHGIDIRVVTAAGEHIGIQCKKYLKFQPSSFKNAVTKLDRARARVDRCILFLSTQATKTVQDACAALEGWSIWDSRILSAKVRELPNDQAVSLVDQFFPGMREEFLGIRTPSPWRPAADAYPASMHGFHLVGRQDLLSELLAFADGGDSPRVGVLVGAAGLGKSRLLSEFAARHEQRTGAIARVLLPGAVAHEAFGALPVADGLLVIVDDAHERSDDLAMAVSGILHERPTAKVVLATRPYGAPVVRQALRTAGVPDHATSTWQLTALKAKEAAELACQILGQGSDIAARALAGVAADSPLLLVSAATRMKYGQLSLETLQSHECVHQLLLDGLVSSTLAKSARPDADRALLHAVAAVQPVATDVPHFQETLSAILGLPFTQINPQLIRLEEEGVLVRRGASIRITPDLLGDVLLAEAAVLRHNGASAGYLERVRDCAQGEALRNALVNAGRVDWQWSGRPRHHGGVIGPLWAVLEAEFRNGGAYTRAELLRLNRKVAPFQPQRAFDLARWAVEHPTERDDRPDEARWMPGDYGHADVLREVPRVLEAVAVDLDMLRSVYDLLWVLGRDDERPLNQHPDGPLRILLGLASYGPGKPLAYQEILLDALTEWLQDDGPNPANRMPLALLDPLFSDGAEGRTFDGTTLTLSRYPVNPAAVAAVRQRATDVLLEEYAAEDQTRAVVAARSFEGLLRGGGPGFEASRAEFLVRLVRLTREVRPGPLVSLAVRRSLGRTLAHDSEPVSAAARAVINALPDSTEHRLACLLHTGPFDRRLRATGNGLAYEGVPRDRTVTDLRGWPVNDAAACIVSLADAGRGVLDRHCQGVQSFLTEALDEIPGLAGALVQRLMHANDDTVRLALPAVLRSWVERDVVTALGSCRQVVSGGSPVHLQAVMEAFRECIPEIAHQDEALGLVRSLATHPDPWVRVGVLNVAASLLHSSRDQALELVTSVPFADVPAELHHLWWAFTVDGLLSWSDLTAPTREFLLEQVTRVRELNHSLQQFIAHIASTDGATAVALLLARIERWESGQVETSFEPLPYHWSAPLQLRQRTDGMELLRSIRDWLSHPRERAWFREMQVPKLFWSCAEGADDAILDLLLEPYRAGATELAHATAPLLSEIPSDVFWNRVDFVAELVRTSAKASPRLGKRAAGALRLAVFSSVRWSAPGQPHPEDVQILERTKQVRAGLPVGSVVDRFYSSLEENAQRRMAWDMAEDAVEG
jgi:transcriptional regulator with XRE-family HTH domain